MAELTVRLAALDGTWETCGVDRYPGVMPESFSAGANEWGADTCSFTLRRDPGDIHPDLSAFTPCEVEVNGNVVWEGRVRETPSRDGDDPSINVAGQGWQYHLDDDVYESVYVHTRLPDWKDLRSVATATLSRIGTSAGQVEVGDGSITFGWPKGAQLTASGPQVGVMLDLGPSSAAKRVVFNYEKPVAAGSAGFIGVVLRGADTENVGTAATGAFEELSVTDISALGATGTLRGTFTTPRRYVALYMYWSNAAAATTGEDNTLKITAARVFRDTAYESGDASILKASTVVGDALDKATVLLSGDRSLISATSFNLPEFALDGYRTPREVVTAVNAYHRWRAKIASGRRMMFAAQPAAPVIEAGNWDGFDFEDASANSGEEIYNRVIVEGTGPDGAPLRAERLRGQAASEALVDVSSQVPNPSFDVDTSGWVPQAGFAVTRDTTVFDSAPAAAQINNGTIGQPTIVDAALTGTFVAGLIYQLSIRVFENTSGGTAVGRVQFGAVSAADYVTAEIAHQSGTWRTYTLLWAPKTNYSSGVVVRYRDSDGSLQLPVRLDTVRLSRLATTLVDRRGFRRTKILPVQSAIDTAAAQQIGDVFLAAHRATPLKGGGRVVGQGGIRRVSTGESVHPSELLLLTTEILRLQHRIDPDTGAQGRDGILASVTYTHATEEASVQLDNERNSLESLLNRMAVVTGAGR